MWINYVAGILGKIAGLKLFAAGRVLNMERLVADSSSSFVDNTDQERQDKLQDCFDLLLAAGYFRARARGLSDFDRLVGGMVWCLRLCQVGVDVDLFYRDTLSLGQKIAVTERVVQMLPLLGCPHSLEPHQVQGCDAEHLFPVMQWLVRQALESQGDSAAKHIDYAVFLFHKYFPSHAPPHTSSAINEVSRKLDEMFSSRFSSVAHAVDETTDDTSKSMTEQTVTNNESLWREFECGETMKSVLKCKEVVEAADLLGFESKVKEYSQFEQDDTLQQLQDQLVSVEAEMQNVAQQFASVQQELVVKNSALNGVLDELAAIKNKTQTLKSNLTSEELAKFPEVRAQLNEVNEVVEKEKLLKEEFRKEFRQLEDSISRLSSQNVSGEVENTWREKVVSVRQELARVSKQVNDIRIQLDQVPDNIEVIQYQKRFVELYDLVYSTQREIKAHYAALNTLSDTLKYLQKALHVLNSIVDNYSAARQTSATRVEFLQQMDAITAGIVANERAVSDKLVEQNRQVDSLKQQLDQVREATRRYHVTLEDFRQQCTLNEKLTEMWENKTS